MPLLPLLFNIVLEILASDLGKKKKSYSNKKGRSKTVTLADHIMLYVENPKKSTKKLLELIN